MQKNRRWTTGGGLWVYDTMKDGIGYSTTGLLGYLYHNPEVKIKGVKKNKYREVITAKSMMGAIGIIREALKVIAPKTCGEGKTVKIIPMAYIMCKDHTKRYTFWEIQTEEGKSIGGFHLWELKGRTVDREGIEFGIDPELVAKKK